MPDISISEDQRERLRAVQEALEAETPYGHVRPRDALEYLLDQYEAGDGVAAASTPDPATSGGGSSSGDDADDSSDTSDDETAAYDTDADDDVDDDTDTDADSDAAVDTDADDADAPATTTAGGDDSMLNSMMSLLDDHADKWDEASGGEEKYVVELPDGTSEPARTKDDVRALLFKHYR